jgi:HD-GYP domain-containing protein (c-di-GMP phosphodiesterase class II)
MLAEEPRSRPNSPKGRPFITFLFSGSSPNRPVLQTAAKSKERRDAGEAGMSETQVLLTRIAVLRQRLEQAHRPVKDSRSPDHPGTESGKSESEGPFSVRHLERQVAEGSKQTVLLSRALREVAPALPTRDAPTLPRQLTARARRILEHGRELLSRLRSLADELEPLPQGAGTQIGARGRQPGGDDPLTERYQETAAMANTALRMIQTFPDSATAQWPLCEGLETTLRVVAERIDGITGVLDRRRREAAEIETLAGLLSAVHAKERVNIQSFVALAESLLAEAQQGAPLRFLYAAPLAASASLLSGGEGTMKGGPAPFIAGHSLNVAQVMARVVRHDPDFRSEPLEPVLAALLHDTGMLSVPAAILVQAGPLDDAQRRLVESHTRLGAELMASLLPNSTWLVEAALGHHERLDGTGYPAGRVEAQLDSLTRLLAVCDVYAALCSTRPHRPAQDTRTALTDTLLLAEQGLLDRYHAERLLRLAFYPVGSVVELADGALGVVVANHIGRQDLSVLARPVLTLLTDTQGQALPVAHHLDLADCENRSIVRSVPKSERRTVLGSRYPELI